MVISPVHFENVPKNAFPIVNRNPEEKKPPPNAKPPATLAGGRSRRKAQDDEDDLDAPVEGRVKICSKSLVFVPSGRENLKRPLIKFMLNEFHDDIQGLDWKDNLNGCLLSFGGTQKAIATSYRLRSLFHVFSTIDLSSLSKYLVPCIFPIFQSGSPSRSSPS